MKAYLQLLRVPNLVTSAGDVLAGAFIVSSMGSGPYATLWLLLLSSIMLYAGGVTLNDVMDASLDQIERPERPIPSGKIGREHAFMLSCLLMLGGIILSLAFSQFSFYISLILALCIVIYNIWAKKYGIPGALVMALCRALNILLGFSFVQEHFWDFALLALLPFLHIIGVTALSRGENHGYTAKTILLISLIPLGIVLWLIGFELFKGSFAFMELFFIALYCFFQGFAYYPAIREPKPAFIKRGVKYGILSLLLLNAALVSIFDGSLHALIVALLIVVSSWLSRSISMT
ncbi:UbiA-like protein EboC [Paenibacillus sp. LMG 31458]|uniref:UbiA-like protein EboC n=1 Tax=Paenibacillus phytorum TaxID=2654977 RepID=A0ABX1XUQ5_9BACL|nr:UbiA-like protein EboC [Paenibacillus phytorum]NOU72268.1 UbiA-like protein EboC [Paenibacillus phytorum]